MPPPVNCVKLNFDGSTLNGGQALGIGVATRNAEGRCLACLSLKLDRKGSADMAETFAAREAVRLAIRQQWKQVILEGDCSLLLAKLSSEQQDFSDISSLVFDIRSAWNLVGNSLFFPQDLTMQSMAT
ncbi:hypothetical protein Sango_1138600 [Sesamum angolense]|uniref:RNase H type-1 domain-containing protein n=1 Tax=Sesamum angolense TaxID=2727404 RepID=A0AAE2BWT0_9LAMI|nr:hypothetical protein Sango_1138600 [Sesamum angolense]